MSDETIRYATEISLEAERKLGAILAEAPKNEGRAGMGRLSLGGTETEPPKDETPTLAELGHHQETSARAQKLSAILLVVPKQNRQNTTRQASRPCRVTNPIGAKCMRRRWMRRMRRTKRF